MEIWWPVAVFSVYIRFRFYRRFLTLNYHPVLNFLLLYLWIKAEEYCNIQLGLYRVFPQELFFILNDIAIGFVLFGGNKKKQVLTAILVNSIGNITVFICLPFAWYLSNMMESQIEINRIFAGVNYLNLSVAAIFLELIGRRFVKFKEEIDWRGVCFLLVLSLFINNAVVDFADRNFQWNRNSLSMMVLCSLYSIFGIGLVLFAIYDTDKRLNSAAFEQQAKLQEQHISNLKEREDMTAAFRHDWKNHLICLSSLLTDGKETEAVNYLEELSFRLNQVEELVPTGNLYADTIIREKKAWAIQENIMFEAELRFPEGLLVNAVDLSIILSNAFDNAIEGCKKLPKSSERRWIRAVSVVERGFFLLEISNGMEQEASVKKGLFRSGKPLTGRYGERIHGIGLHNIRQAVKKNQGIMEISAEDGQFRLSVMFHIGAIHDQIRPIDAASVKLEDT